MEVILVGPQGLAADVLQGLEGSLVDTENIPTGARSRQMRTPPLATVRPPRDSSMCNRHAAVGAVCCCITTLPVLRATFLPSLHLTIARHSRSVHLP